jgi:hypothetical protein
VLVFPSTIKAKAKAVLSPKMILNMMPHSILISFKVPTNRTLRHRAFPKPRRVDLCLRILSLINPQALHAIGQTLVYRGVCRALRRIAAVETFVGVRDGVVAAADAFALCGLRRKFVARVASG